MIIRIVTPLVSGSDLFVGDHRFLVMTADDDNQNTADRRASCWRF